MKPYAIAFVFLIFFGTIHAQQTTPVPLTPDQIFVEGVQWSVVEPEPTRPNTVKLDRTGKILSVFDETTNTWQDYVLRDDITPIQWAHKEDDGSVKLYRKNEWEEFEPGDIILFDPRTRLYTYPQTVCDGQVFRAEVGEGEWTVAYFDDQHSLGYLCFSEDDSRLDVLPPGKFIRWWVFPSPDKAYLLLAGESWEASSDYQIYAYHFQDNQLTKLDVIEEGSGDTISAGTWVTNTQGLLCTFYVFRNFPGSWCYTFDLTQTNSVEFAFSGLSETNLWLDDPERYVGIYSQEYYTWVYGSGGPEHKPCTLTLYDAAGVRTRELGYKCLPILLDEITPVLWHRYENQLYFLTTESQDSTVSKLHRFDLEREKDIASSWIFRGEIETILNVSPDNQFIVLLTGSDGELNIEWRRESCCFSQDYGLRITILRVSDAQIVYRSEPIEVYTSEQIHWLDETTVVILSAEGFEIMRVTDEGDISNPQFPATLRRIDLTSGDVFITKRWTTPENPSQYVNFLKLDTSPNGYYWINHNKILIDLRTFEQVPLLRDDIPEEQRISISWAKDSTLEVAGGGARYRIVLP